jgi:protein-S-isoprenylcysteine O-methyltransferase
MAQSTIPKSFPSPASSSHQSSNRHTRIPAEMAVDWTPDFSQSTTFASSEQASIPQYRATRPGEHASNDIHANDSSRSRSWTTPNAPSRIIDPSNLPTGKRSLAGISLRAFLLGQLSSLSLLATILLLLQTTTTLWRAPFFLFSLSLFHFLEYYITARYNPSYATISAFLLSQNGAAYTIAHTSALAECLLSRLLLFSSPSSAYFTTTSLPLGGPRGQIVLGLFLMLIGQTTRSLAMAQAGVSFTHRVQYQRREEHELVTHGVYSWLRHPSYFGFFWWGLGSQLVLGNVVCLVGYAVVLWKFFSDRIKSEEQLLVKFFGKQYVEYRAKTWVGIPGIS